MGVVIKVPAFVYTTGLIVTPPNITGETTALLKYAFPEIK